MFLRENISMFSEKKDEKGSLQYVVKTFELPTVWFRNKRSLFKSHNYQRTVP
jgi:hypothetical protein